MQTRNIIRNINYSQRTIHWKGSPFLLLSYAAECSGTAAVRISLDTRSRRERKKGKEINEVRFFASAHPKCKSHYQVGAYAFNKLRDKIRKFWTTVQSGLSFSLKRIHANAALIKTQNFTPTGLAARRDKPLRCWHRLSLTAFKMFFCGENSHKIPLDSHQKLWLSNARD